MSAPNPAPLFDLALKEASAALGLTMAQVARGAVGAVKARVLAAAAVEALGVDRALVLAGFQVTKDTYLTPCGLAKANVSAELVERLRASLASSDLAAVVAQLPRREPPTPPDSKWTPERLEMLKAHFELGLSCAQSAKLIGGVSRNAVIGKRNRMGLIRDAVSTPAPRPAQTLRLPRPPTPAITELSAPVVKRAIHQGGRRGPVEPVILEEPPEPLPVCLEAVPPTAKPWTERAFGECCAVVVEAIAGAEAMSCCLPADRRGWCKRHADRFLDPRKPTKPNAYDPTIVRRRA